VFSYLGKSGDTRATLYRPHVDGKLLGVSFITVGEILFEAYKNKWGNAKLEQIKARLRSVTIVPYDWAVCQTYGELKARLQEVGKSVGDNDLWIAACAVRHSIPLVSNNRAHFENIPGLVLISEAPIIAQIASQQKLFKDQKATDASESEPPSSKTPSS
jgi:tRNA(fMet)-specific endonuclease VapC